MDSFWMEVERIQQRDGPREEDGVGEGRPLEGEAPGGAAGHREAPPVLFRERGNKAALTQKPWFGA